MLDREQGRGGAAGDTELGVDVLKVVGGFRLAELRAGAVERSRAVRKPEIPAVGDYGIPLRDELVLDRPLSDP